jgi:transcriptional regulator with AAA-type ATPase domain/tetratricopeptide (TPR) repeat protein
MKPLADLLGDSPGIQAIREQISRLLTRQQDARRLPPVLIEGETGTGKGLLARVIHRAGPRHDGPFVDVNCAAIPETLLEAEMFGFEKGAFTDARRSKPGLLQTAHRGTIFLDEVGLLSEGLQAKLLKVLEERTVRRLGATRDEPIDVWLLTATNEDLKSAIHARRFREDLYHRLAVLTLTLPPLRERGEDILMLAKHYLSRACNDYGVSAKTLAVDAQAALRGYSWPGNVRELANLMERVALLSSDPAVTASALGLTPAPPPKAAASTIAPAGSPSSLDDAVRDRVVEVLTQTSWNISRTAALLGISRNTLRARIEKYGLRQGEAPAPPPPAVRSERRQARRADPAPAAPEAEPHPVIVAPPAPAPVPLEWERRRVTMLRASLLAPSAPEALLETNRALELLLDKVRSFGGTIEGRGPTGIAAAFGLDPTEDAPSRAAHAAMAVVNAVKRARQDAGSGPAIKVGVHTSPMLVGRGNGAPELDLEGKQAALSVLNALITRGEADSVTVSEATAPFLTRGFEFRDLDDDEYGRGRAYTLVARGRTTVGRQGTVSTFVGRDRELELLSSRLNSAIRGRGQIVGISGEAGIGKSRLIYELRESLMGRGVTCLEGRCHSHGTAVPYLPIVDVLRSACGIVDGDEPAVMADKARTTLLEAGLDLVETAPYFLHLLDIEQDPDHFAALTPDVTKTRIFETLRQLIVRKSRQAPLVIVVEDLHWIDSTSEEFLASLAAVLPGAALLVVYTHRGGYRPSWIEKSYATQVSLQPLAPDESLRIVQSVLGPDQALTSLFELIVGKAEGNPFFIEELARTVREQIGVAMPMTVPDTVEEVLGGRIDRLAADERRLLEVAAVVGKDVPLAVLRAVSGLPDDTVLRALDRLKSAEFLYETSPGPEIELTFKHALTHEVAYQRLLPEAQCGLHARIVEAIERLYENRLTEQVDRLAHHALRGQAWAKAVDYLRQAAARAAARSAHRDAIAHFEQALVALGHLPKDRTWTEHAIDIRLDLRLVLLPLGELEAILAHLREAEALAETLDDQHRTGRVSVYMTGQYYQMGHHERALEYGRRTLAISEALHDFSLDVATNAYVGQIHLGLGDYRTATTFFRKNVEAIVGELTQQRFGLPQLPAVHSRYCLVLCLAEMGEFAEGIVRGQESIGIAESIEQPLNITAATSGLGRLYLRKGDLERAMPILVRALDVGRTWNLRIWLPQVQTALGLSYAAMGRLADALPLLEEAVELAGAMRLLSGQAPALTALAEARMLSGRLAEALEAAQSGLTTAQQNGRRGHEAWALRTLGEIALCRHDTRPAQDNFTRSLALATELDMRPLAAHCQLGLSRAARLAKDHEAAERHLRAAVGLFSEMQMGIWLAQASEELAKSR